MAFSFKMANNTIAGIVYKTCGAIWDSLLSQHMPDIDKDTLQNAATEFMDKWGFPNCCGCVDGKHVRIKCPPNSSSKFYNYKSLFSIVLQGLADANSRFLSIDVGAYGRQSESGILTNSSLYEKLQNSDIMPDDKPLPYSDNRPAPSIALPHVILGDQGYPLKTYLLKPYTRQSATEDELYLNYRLSSVRWVVECPFGILVGKWRNLNPKYNVTQKTLIQSLNVRVYCITSLLTKKAIRVSLTLWQEKYKRIPLPLIDQVLTLDGTTEVQRSQ